MSARSVNPPPLYAVTDHSWHVFGAALCVALIASGAYCAWRAFSPPAEIPAPEVAAPAFPVVLPTAFPPAPLSPPRVLPVAVQPLSWHDLSLMLRTGLTDEEVIAAIRGKQLVNTVDASAASSLRELGAGDRLIRYLQTRPVYALSPSMPAVIVTAPAPPRTAAPVQSATPPPPTAVDHVARDRQIKDLQKQIDAMDEQIRHLRDHPNPYRVPGASFNDRGPWGGESSLKSSLDWLEQQRNDLRREKWRLEGR